MDIPDIFDPLIQLNWHSVLYSTSLTLNADIALKKNQQFQL